MSPSDAEQPKPESPKSDSPKQPKHARLDWDALRRAVEQHPYRPNTEWAREFKTSESTIRYALGQMKLLRKRRPAASTVRRALQFEDIHDFSFGSAAVIDGNDKLQRMARSRSSEEKEAMFDIAEIDG
jgi:hypothetical protein